MHSSAAGCCRGLCCSVPACLPEVAVPLPPPSLLRQMLLLLQPSSLDPLLQRAPLPGLRGTLLDALAMLLATRPAGVVVPTLVFVLPLPAAALTHIAVVCLSKIDASICQTEVCWYAVPSGASERSLAPMQASQSTRLTVISPCAPVSSTCPGAAAAAHDARSYTAAAAHAGCGWTLPRWLQPPRALLSRT